MNTPDKVISYTALFTVLAILLSSLSAVCAAIALWTAHVSYMFWFEATKNGLSLAWKIAVCEYSPPQSCGMFRTRFAELPDPFF
jgi:hypothetical protein